MAIFWPGVGDAHHLQAIGVDEEVEIGMKACSPPRRPRMSASDFDVFAGVRLRDTRHGMGVSMQQLADAIGVSYQQIQKYESGRNRMAASTLWTIANEFDVDIRTFFPADPSEGFSEAARRDDDLRTLIDRFRGLDQDRRTEALRLIASM